MQSLASRTMVIMEKREFNPLVATRTTTEMPGLERALDDAFNLGKEPPMVSASQRKAACFNAPCLGTKMREYVKRTARLRMMGSRAGDRRRETMDKIKAREMNNTLR